MKIKNSLSSKISFILVLTILVIMIFVGFIIFYFEKQIISNNINKHSKETLNRLINNIAYPLWIVDKSQIKNVISLEMGTKDVLGVFLYNNPGKEFLIGFEKKEGLVEAQVILTKEELHDLKNYYIKLEETIFKENIDIGQIIIYYSNESLKEAVKLLVLKTILLFFFLAGAIVVIIYLSFDKIILKPILKLNDVVNAFSRMNFISRAVINSNDEIGNLCRNVNNMADIIEKYNEDLQSTNEELEESYQALSSSEEETKEALMEKEALLREVYHRTKNNMQVISAYLNLQAMYHDDENLQLIVKDTITRIQSMSLVHEKLYKSKNLSRINAKEYIEDLVFVIMSYNEINNKIKSVIEIENIELVIDIAIPLGLVMNELISNSFKHAFSKIENGILKIKLYRENNETINIEVADNGNGLPADFDPNECKSIGLLTAINIVQSQLSGSINFENSGGLVWKIKIKDKINE